MIRFGIICLAALLIQCNGKPTQQALLKRIEKAEAVMGADKMPVPEHALEAAQLYIEYVRAFPHDTVRNPEFWFRAAELHNAAEQPDTAIAVTDSLLRHYPRHRMVPTVLLFRGAVYEMSLGQLGKARQEYLRVTSEFNTPEYYEEVTAALSSLENLGKTGDQIFQEMKEKGLIEE
jgi:hypothetical protein